MRLLDPRPRVSIRLRLAAGGNTPDGKVILQGVNVSIRLRLTSRRKPSRQSRQMKHKQTFQSASGSPAGGNLGLVGLHQRRVSFQSASGSPAGGNLVHRQDDLRVSDDVSIRLRLTSRRKRGSEAADVALHQVSIRLRLTSRRKLRNRAWPASCGWRFDPASGSPAGGNACDGGGRLLAPGFNPPPAHQPEETLSGPLVSRLVLVSIRLRLTSRRKPPPGLGPVQHVA